MLFLPIIFFPILGFGKAEYTGPIKSSNKGIIIASSVLGVLWFLLFIVLIIAVFVVSVKTISNIDTGKYLNEFESKVESVREIEETTEFEESKVSESKGFKTVTLDNKELTLDVEVFDSSDAFVSGASAVSSSDGISLDVSLDYMSLKDHDKSLEDLVKEKSESTVRVFKDMGNIYSDVTVDSVYSDEDYALQQVNYTYHLGGKEYSCFTICKVDMYMGYPLYTTVEVNNYNATLNTRSLFEDVCNKYGILFGFE